MRLALPLIRRAIPGSDAFDVVSPYGYPSPIAQFEDVALVRGAFSAVAQTLREQGFVSMFVRLHPILELPDGAFTGLGTLIVHGQTVSIDLRQNEAEQWRGIRARYRTFLNRSARLGHRAFMDDTGEHFDRFITLYLETMRRHNAAPEYFFSRDYLSGLWQQLRGHVHLGVVEVNGLIVCAGLFGESSGIVQYHLSGTDEQALALSPLKILIDYARCWATRRGANVLRDTTPWPSADTSLGKPLRCSCTLQSAFPPASRSRREVHNALQDRHFRSSTRPDLSNLARNPGWEPSHCRREIRPTLDRGNGRGIPFLNAAGRRWRGSARGPSSRRPRGEPDSRSA